MRHLAVVALVAVTALAASADEKPVARWEAVPYFGHGKPGRKIDMVVIHTVEGSASSCVQTFRHSPRHVSAHYIVAKDGTVTQCVKDEDVAWHAGSVNDRSIGIEHEGFSKRRDTWTDASYAASARLTRWLCDRYGVPIDRQHIIGHKEAPSSPHGDPGPYFDWDRYMKLVRGDVAAVATASNGEEGLPLDVALTDGERGTSCTTEPGQAPSGPQAAARADLLPGASDGLVQALDRAAPSAKADAKEAKPGHPLLARGARGETVRDLQARLNADAKACVIAEDGIFGPETEKAVRAFQEKHACRIDGIVGPETWGALDR